MTLEQLFAHYGSDKGGHGYAPIYECLFTGRTITSLLEVGIGTMTPGVNSSMVGYGGNGYKPGASLRAWRDYLPHARITGMDVQPDTQFVEERISTILQDSTAPVTGLGFFEVVIDDGSHRPEDQLSTLRNLWPFAILYYVIEDITGPQFREDEITDIVGANSFFFVKPRDVSMLVIARR